MDTGRVGNFGKRNLNISIGVLEVSERGCRVGALFLGLFLLGKVAIFLEALETWPCFTKVKWEGTLVETPPTSCFLVYL